MLKTLLLAAVATLAVSSAHAYDSFYTDGQADSLGGRMTTNNFTGEHYYTTPNAGGGWNTQNTFTGQRCTSAPSGSGWNTQCF